MKPRKNDRRKQTPRRRVERCEKQEKEMLAECRKIIASKLDAAYEPKEHSLEWFKKNVLNFVAEPMPYERHAKANYEPSVIVMACSVTGCGATYKGEDWPAGWVQDGGYERATLYYCPAHRDLCGERPQ